ncbi:hypothetical protein [Shimazuella alba]|uniref:Uncharacterized protein n=1 Tax=Shimazuella alba TaxID=2690964 RepID=A0A6I4W1Q9_9BACL|nr:hypothetical protein [Shimazuella alba]MXQ54212.1 hypothetical protein [Shimazuella alba]
MRSRPWPGIYLWICLILLVEGFLNFVFVMEYDILMSFAVTAIIVSLIIKAGDRAIKWAFISFGGINFVFYLGVTLLIIALQQSRGNISLEDINTVLLYQHGTWWDIVSPIFGSYGLR